MQNADAPENSIQIWTSGDELKLRIPPSEGQEYSHVLTIPLAKCSVECSTWGSPIARQLGWHTLLQMLRAREAAGHAQPIGHLAAPPQYDIEQMLKSMKIKRIDSVRKIAARDDLTLEDLDL